MEEYYKALGLSADATDEKVKEQYEKLLRIYNPEKFREPSQKRHAEKSRKEITEAYEKIIGTKSSSNKTASSKTGTYNRSSNGQYYSYSHNNTATAQATEYATGPEVEYHKSAQGSVTVKSRQEFYEIIRGMIQKKQYNSAISQLAAHPFYEDAEWNFLMGSAKYFAGYISDSYNYFADAARLDPDKREYVATFNRMSQSRNGRVYSSPYQSGEKKNDIMTWLENNKGIIGRLICLGCMCN